MSQAPIPRDVLDRPEVSSRETKPVPTRSNTARQREISRPIHGEEHDIPDHDAFRADRDISRYRFGYPLYRASK